MACSCQQAHPFDIIVNNQKRIIYGLDVIVFVTTMSKPETRVEAEKQLWKNALAYNQIERREEGYYKEALYDAYLKMKHLFERYR